MPSKELIEKIAFIIRHDKDGSPEDTARDILEAILAALQEPTEAMLLAAKGFGDTQAWQEMLNASALGEQSE